MAASQTLRTLKLSLLADVSEFGKGMGKATSDFQKFSRGVEQASRVATGIIGAIGGIAASAINAASDLGETASAVEQIFGPDSARNLQRFARTTATSLGLSRQAALQAAQQFGIFGQAANLSGSALTEFTIDLTTLAADLASFNNTTVDQAITALGAALRGESEPIRNYGVLLSAATIENRALADGLIESKDELDAQTRILATFNEILAQTTLQQGDAIRTGESLANQQKQLTAELENFRVEIGEELLPVVELLLPKLRAFVSSITESDPEQIVAIGEAITKMAVAIVALNTALKVFTTLQAAFKLVAGVAASGAAGATAVGVGGAAALAVGTAQVAQNLDPVTSSRLASIAAGGRTVPTAPAIPFARGVNPLTGTGRTAASQPIIVNGVVGSTYQVFRELERIDAAGRSSGTTIPSRIR